MQQDTNVETSAKDDYEVLNKIENRKHNKNNRTHKFD